VRIDVIRVYDVDIICEGNPIRLGGDRAEEMSVRHAAVSANFLSVVDLKPGASVVLRIGGDTAVRYLVLLNSGERGEGAPMMRHARRHCQ
jgi:hypothetical protein